MVVEEVPLDDLAFVAQRDDELAMSVAGVEIHDVPKHRLAADLDHRLGLQPGFFLKPSAQSPRQNCNLHGRILDAHEMSAVCEWLANRGRTLCRSIGQRRRETIAKSIGPTQGQWMTTQGQWMRGEEGKVSGGWQSVRTR